MYEDDRLDQEQSHCFAIGCLKNRLEKSKWCEGNGNSFNDSSSSIETTYETQIFCYEFSRCIEHNFILIQRFNLERNDENLNE